MGEKRGYVKAGPWTPESAVEDPEAVRQLHREFLRAGADVMQAFTFYASEDKLTNRGNKAGKTIGVEAINRACQACQGGRRRGWRAYPWRNLAVPLLLVWNVQG